MLLCYNLYEPEGKIRHAEWLQVARQHKIPTLLDAAADIPPVDALWKFTQMGYDMVAFSGGKGLRGPQDAGVLLGRKQFIEAAKKNTSPHCGSIGRGLKVSKEDMVAMWAAVERYVKLDHAAELRELENKLSVIEAALEGLPVSAERIVPPVANHFPHLLLRWDEQRLRLTPAQLKQQLADGDPSIHTARVHGTGNEGFLISVFTLAEGEEQLVAARLRQIFSS
jgi:L-seryl-tRNA(Ser) seleniumtransferase